VAICSNDRQLDRPQDTIYTVGQAFQIAFLKGLENSMSITNRVSGMRMAGVARILGVLLIVAGGCSSPEVLPTSGPHPALSATEVQLYQKQPGRYEKLADLAITITPEMRWDERGDANACFEQLKAKAAAVGANGVLLVTGKSQYDYLATAGYKGTFYQVPVRGGQPRIVVAEAIYMIKE
jgi:hypothetical protein